MRMRGKMAKIYRAKAHLSRLIGRVERVISARVARPVAEPRSVRKVRKRSTLMDEALLHLEEYSYDGPIGPTTNWEIDRTVYGI
jgi:cyanate lyase